MGPQSVALHQLGIVRKKWSVLDEAPRIVERDGDEIVIVLDIHN